MFLNLFDGHPELLVYPTDLNVLYAYFPQFLAEVEDRDRREVRLEQVLFTDMKNQGTLEGRTDVDAFAARFYQRLAGSDLGDIDEILEALTEAFAQGLPAAERKYAVLKETSCEMYMSELLAGHPQSRCIHLVRDPRDNFGALRAGIERYRTFGDDEKSLLFSVINRLLMGMGTALANFEVFGRERYRILRFEDLVTRPRQEMESLCTWLGIAFDECLLTPTRLGRPTRGNSYDSPAFETVCTQNIGRWPQRILEKEARILEFYLGDLMERFGYERAFAARDALPALGEFYKWMNYKYFYFDRFQDTLTGA
jgi:hypothetical protein